MGFRAAQSIRRPGRCADHGCRGQPDGEIENNDHLREFITDLAADPRGFPLRVYQFDRSEHLARARVVHNMVEIDPDAPTLSEVREMMEEVEAEMAAEQEGEL